MLAPEWPVSGLENYCLLFVGKQVLMSLLPSLSLPEMAEELSHMEASPEWHLVNSRIKKAQVCVAVALCSVCVHASLQ